MSETSPSITAALPIFMSPVLTFTGRNGQAIGVDLFSNPSGNYNGCVVGTSGLGKSAFLNELAERYLAMGAKVCIFDLGRSYEKKARVVIKETSRPGNE